jgi:hypothetical protein
VGKLLLELAIDAYEPESEPKELDAKEVKDCKEVPELPEELSEEVNHDAEEDSDESQAVIVVVFWA